MKKLLLLTTLLLTTPVQAQQSKPFRYESPCILETPQEMYPDVCTVIETREPGGALKSRNIFSNKFALTIKSRFDPQKGFVTWDSHNKYEYKWEYKVGGNQELGTWSYVMPGFLLQNVSWD